MGPLVAAAAAAVFAFWPQGGVLGRDLTFANSVDLDPAAGSTLDPWCGRRTYDGHNGEDVLVRSFREVDLGVPVFSLTDGTVFEVQDGLYDYRFGPTVSTFDNHVIVGAPDGKFFVYGHLRHGLTLKKGQVVHAGDQLGWSASSGNSAWPHLHLTELAGDAAHELFAGPCNPQGGDTLAVPAFAGATYARNVVVSARPFTGRAQLPWDEAKRTGTFVVGTRDVYIRLELGEYSGGTPTVQIGEARDPQPQLTPETPYARSSFDIHESVRFDHVGTWPLRITLNGATLVSAPLRVVASAKQIRNRPPLPVTVQVTTSGGLAQCVVLSPFAVRDPDFDVVRYEYRWYAGAKVLRRVTSAMVSDIVRVPENGARPRCRVTPSDGRLSGVPATG